MYLAVSPSLAYNDSDMRKLCWGLILSAVVVGGCGGGGGGAGKDPGGTADVAFELGKLSGRAASTNPPLTTNSPNITATSLTGLITLLRLRDQQLEKGEGRIVFSSRAGNQTGVNRELYSCNLDGSDLVRITNTPGIDERMCAVSPDGKRIAFVALGTGGDNEIFVMNIDGSNRVQLTNNNAQDYTPRWSPAGTAIVYESNQNIYRVNVNTKVETPIVADLNPSVQPDFTADGQNIIFNSFNRLGDGKLQFHSVPAGGGPVTLFLSTAQDKFFPRLSPDGLSILYMSGTQLWKQTLGGQPVAVAGVTTPESYTWSPDAKFIAFSGDGSNALFISNGNGSGAYEVLPDLEAEKFNPSFVPAPSEVIFVGSGSLFGSRLAGFIFSQAGPQVRALLGFDAATPSSAVVTRQTGENNQGPNLVYSIDADTVSEISYAHAPYWTPVKVVGGGTSVPAADGALVSIDGVTGRVVAVLPFAGVRSHASFREEDGQQVFTGNFLGVFDGSGKNLGPASEVRLDAADNSLLITK